MIYLIPDSETLQHALYPFTATRPCWDIRIGILTIREKWEYLLGVMLNPDDMGGAAVLAVRPSSRIISIPGNWIPAPETIKSLNAGETLQPGQTLEHPWDIFRLNDWALRQDFEILTRKRVSQPLPESVQVTGAAQIFVEKGAVLSHCTLNATTGPIYIGKNTEIMEGAHIRGPFALCEGSVVKMGACIYGATTIGPGCVVGGEIKNSILFGHSNKGHEGYLGDSVIGEWCNLGAGTSVSNVRNTASPVKVWSAATHDYQEAGLKCGLLMGDYSRAAINTSFNTGTVVGVSCNIFCSQLTPKFIPDFTWMGENPDQYHWDNALRDISNWKALKKQALLEPEINKLSALYKKRWG